MCRAMNDLTVQARGAPHRNQGARRCSGLRMEALRLLNRPKCLRWRLLWSVSSLPKHARVFAPYEHSSSTAKELVSFHTISVWADTDLCPRTTSCGNKNREVCAHTNRHAASSSCRKPTEASQPGVGNIPFWSGSRPCFARKPRTSKPPPGSRSITPFSVMMPWMSSAGVTSNPGFHTCATQTAS